MPNCRTDVLRYLEPPLVVNVDDKLIALAREGRLQVRATLCLTLTDETIDRTQDNKQEILQGALRLTSLIHNAKAT